MTQCSGVDRGRGGSRSRCTEWRHPCLHAAQWRWSPRVRGPRGGGLSHVREPICKPDSVTVVFDSRRPSIWEPRCQDPRAAYPGPSGGQPGPCLALHRVGFAEPSSSPMTLVVSYTTVSPLPCELMLALAVCSLLHFPSGHPAWKLSSTLPFGVRTFLDPLRQRAAAVRWARAPIVPVNRRWSPGIVVSRPATRTDRPRPQRPGRARGRWVSRPGCRRAVPRSRSKTPEGVP